MFNKQNFCHVASNNRNEKKAGIFVYKTTDDLETVSASGYFNEKIIDLNLHDLIIHEQTNNTDRTKVKYNYLAVTERTLDNVGTTVIKRDLDIELEEAIEDLEEYVDEHFVKIDGTSTMTGPLRMRASISFQCAIAPSWDGVGFYQLNSDDSLTLLASIETPGGFCPGTTNTYDLGSSALAWKDLRLAGKAYIATVNNGYDIAVPVTNSADTFALKSQVDDAANSGEQLYTTGVWYAKMYAATTVPTGAEYDGCNYADFSQVDSGNNPIIVVYEGQSGAWVEIARITPPATHNGYMTITSKIWDIAEQAGQQGGKVLWSHTQHTFTPYPLIISFENINVTGESTVAMPQNPGLTQIVNKQYVDSRITGASSTNCLTNVPQDINLEISNNNLVLKAGSKVYVPNGFEQDGVTPHFDVITIANDISGTVSFNGTCTVVYMPSNNGISLYSSAVDSSGSTDPSVTATFYNTTQNIMKRFDGSSLSRSGFSFPIARVVTTTSGVQSIKEVSNGFGHIGSTIFGLPGVTGLIPNGRNADGTLKSTSWAISNVITYTYDSTNNGVYVFGFFGASFSRIGINAYRYDEPKNMHYNGSNQWKATLLGFIKITNGVIDNLPVRTTFHALDYNDIVNVIYPVGSLYFGTQTTCPMQLLYPNTGWTRVATKVITDITGIKGSIGTSSASDNGKYFVAQTTSFGQQTVPQSGGYNINVAKNQTITGASVTNSSVTMNVWRRDY